VKSATRKILDWILGTTLILIGIVGFFLPILQGWVFVIAGLAVLSSHSRWANALYQKVKSFGRGVRDRVLHRRPRPGRTSDDSGRAA
jgi:uncharacterized membrane protein YbaN (DUF454 family)